MGKVTHGEGRCLGSGPGDLRRATMRDPYGVQGRLAAALGVSTSSVSYWRKGTHVPREEHWPLIEEFVDLPAGELGPPNATAPRPRRGNGPATKAGRCTHAPGIIAPGGEAFTLTPRRRHGPVSTGA